MRALAAQPSLVERACEAIISEIVGGGLATGSRLIQDDLARALGVSRQPVQQALLILRTQGFVRDARGRGLVVAPLEASEVRDLYQLRGAMEREGGALIAEGRAALSRGSRVEQIAADIAFHQLLARASGNAMLEGALAPHWAKFRRIMAEVLREGEQRSRRIWDEHAAILEAVVAGDDARAESIVRNHLAKASHLLVLRIDERTEESSTPANDEIVPAMA